MPTERCETCGTPLVGHGECPACRRPEIGHPRRAPRGSESATPTTRDPGREISRGWDALVLGTITLLVVVAAVAWLV